jgi:hypothetical protein
LKGNTALTMGRTHRIRDLHIENVIGWDVIIRTQDLR